MKSVSYTHLALGRNRDTSTINIQNCIIFTVLNNLRATLKNNIIYRSIHGDYDFEYSSGSFNPLHPACSVYNNVFCTEGDFLSNVITKDNNWLNVEYNTLLNKDTQIYSDDEMYELTNEAQTAYIGTCLLYTSTINLIVCIFFLTCISAYAKTYFSQNK